MKMHTNRHQEAKLLPPDTFLSRKNAFAAGAPQLVMGEGPPGKGEGKREKREGRGKGMGGVGREGEGISPRTKILATALNSRPYSPLLVTGADNNTRKRSVLSRKKNV